MLRSKTAVDWQCISLLEITILELRNRAFLTNDYDSFNMLTSFKLSWSNTNLLFFRFHNICLLKRTLAISFVENLLLLEKEKIENWLFLV